MQIVLVRHGKPEKNSASIHASQIQDWVQQYNSADLDNSSKPPAPLLAVAKLSDVVFSSDLKRSQQSAQLLTTTTQPGLAIYREVDLPNLRFPSPKLSPSTWVALFRLLWLFGLSKQCESFPKARKRAQFAASQLEQAAQQYGSVMLVGHGLFNRFIAKVLVKQNWLGPSSLGNQYWDYAIFKKQDK